MLTPPAGLCSPAGPLHAPTYPLEGFLQSLLQAGIPVQGILSVQREDFLPAERNEPYSRCRKGAQQGQEILVTPVQWAQEAGNRHLVSSRHQSHGNADEGTLRGIEHGFGVAPFSSTLCESHVVWQFECNEEVADEAPPV